jgi:acyl carrier protein
MLPDINVSQHDLFSEVARIISEVKREPSLAGNLTPSTDLLRNIGFDSVELTDLFLRLEVELKLLIDFDRLTLAALSTMKTLLEFLNSSGRNA